MTRFALPLLLSFFLSLSLRAQKATTEKETDPLVLKKLEWFQDMKFGLLMHWGPYSQWSIVESWSLCNEDEPWCQRTGKHAANYTEYLKAYENLKTTFNPVKFDPDSWARAAADAGMKYVVFTTKHHDGFCMFDTKQTDYKITDAACPFHSHPKANIAKEIFSAFRANGFGVGAYFSKPDWHSPFYWDPYWQHPDRNVNYAIKKYPEKWKRFREFTFNQIEELMTGYGAIDILWLDGGWVAPSNRDQDVDIPGIATMARRHQPGLIVVDRAVPGRYENYRTPEQEIPEKPLDYVWETCMTMATSWSYVENDTYKSTRTLIHTLVDIVTKGGNFLLNIGPSPEGELPRESLVRLKQIGEWMKVNGNAIYKTRPYPPFKEGNICFTRLPGRFINAIYLAGENEVTLPPVVSIRSFGMRKSTVVHLLGVDEPLRIEPNGDGMLIYIPESIRNMPPCSDAWTFEISHAIKRGISR